MDNNEHPEKKNISLDEPAEDILQEDDVILHRRRILRDEQSNYHTITPVFVVGDSFFRSRVPKSSHWSIAWSDLMMTMFILFLSLFVYQVAHREFLKEDNPEVVAGQYMNLPPQADTAFPFSPIFPVQSEKKADVLKRLEPTETVPEEVDAIFESEPEDISQPEPLPLKDEQQEETSETEAAPLEEDTQDVEFVAQPEENIVLVSPELPAEQVAPQEKDIITEIYDLSRETVASEKLAKFADVELIPDKTMRIILTGDLLFETGQAELSDQAKDSLQKLGEIIRNTPYMINVTGHTDSQPMHSARYPTNWDLSVARASRVARFLVEDIKIPGNQIVVTGYSYFRPVAPNDNEKNRSANRRVEIFLSKQLPPAQTASPENLNNFE